MSDPTKENTVTHLTKEEIQFKWFMEASAVVYLVVGFLFALFPQSVLQAFNLVSRHIFPRWPMAPHDAGKFWVSLTFSMMMTIAALAWIASLHVRNNKNYAVPLMISKCASALSGLLYFLIGARCLAYIGIFLVDGALFVLTLVFYLRANKAWFEEHTDFLRQPVVNPKPLGPATVAVCTGGDKFAMLHRALEESGFKDVLDRRFRESGKDAKDFRVVIKPNFMFMHSKADVSTYTDPALVEALIDKIVGEYHYPNVAIVEAQSTLGNYYANRDVLSVAKYVGYTAKNYRIADLTLEKVDFDYGGRLGHHPAGKTWMEADFRVSFAKNKTHVFFDYTLTLKNIYGTLPMQNKLQEYHTHRAYDWPTILSMKHFPVHFGIIDAFISADGDFGVITDPHPKHTNTMIAGESLIAVDAVGASKMGLDPDDPQIGRFMGLAVEAFGKPDPIVVVGGGDRSVYDGWVKVNRLFIDSLDFIEEAYHFSNWMFGGLTAMDPYFTFLPKGRALLWFRKILAPIKRIFYPHDKM